MLRGLQVCDCVGFPSFPLLFNISCECVEWGSTWGAGVELPLVNALKEEEKRWKVVGTSR